MSETTGISWAESRTGPLNNNWKGGRFTDQRGYVLVRVGEDHHLADVRGYAYEHRIVAEEKLERRLRAGEEVHHVNHRKADNRPENLHVFGSRAEHKVAHRSTAGSLKRLPGEENVMVKCGCGCGSRFLRYDSSNRPRRFVTGHNMRQPGRVA